MVSPAEMQAQQELAQLEKGGSGSQSVQARAERDVLEALYTTQEVLMRLARRLRLVLEPVTSVTPAGVRMRVSWPRIV
jgi:hypothetical protein